MYNIIRIIDFYNKGVRMAQRLNITINDSLFKRLQIVKESFNISAICQEAIEREVSWQEQKKEVITKMNEVITKLRLGKEKFDEKYFEMGKEAGLEDAKQMEYEEIMEVLCNQGAIIKTDTWDSYQADVSSDLQYEDKAFDVYIYADGWAKGVKEFWDIVKEQL
jgi:post-segregation antitoxin (ccd killing protein)